MPVIRTQAYKTAILGIMVSILFAQEAVSALPQQKPVAAGGVTAFTIPAVPDKPDASDRTLVDRIRVLWPTVRGATAYKVVRCTGTNINTCGRPVDVKRPPFDDRGLSYKRVYYYRVKACNRNGATCSDYSAPDAGQRKKRPRPMRPGKPDASDGTSSSGVIVKMFPVRGSHSYYLKVCSTELLSSCNRRTYLDTYPFNTRGSMSPFTHTVTANIAPVGKTHYFRVIACNEGGCSEPSPADPGWIASTNPSSQRLPTITTARNNIPRVTVPVKRKFTIDTIRFNVPLYVTDIHPDIEFVVPLCRIFNSRSVMSNANEVGIKYTNVPVTRKNRKTGQVIKQVILDLKRPANIHNGKRLEQAVSYSCTLYIRRKGSSSLLVYSASSHDPRTRAKTTPVNVVTGSINQPRVVRVGQTTINLRTAKLKAQGNP